LRVSDAFNLGATQGSLDFVDVDITDDVPVFIDPTAIRTQHGDWAEKCQLELQTFFEELLAAIKAKDLPLTRKLIYPLIEPNETHLGNSRGKSRGRGLGHNKNSERLVQALTESKAASTGLLQDLEDTALFIERIGRDIISDMTTCVIRGSLIEYTQQMCLFHEIPLEDQESGPIWDHTSSKWLESSLVKLPRGGSNKLLLVPKSIVRLRPTVDSGEYYRGYLRPYFEDEELNRPGSSLVEVLKDGRRKVRKKKLDEKLGTTKPDNVVNSLSYPQAMDDYRKDLLGKASGPLNSSQFAEFTGTPQTNYRELLDEVLSISPGAAGANPYHRAIAKLLTAMFETSLGNEHIETALHDGLKRIDITYDNVAGNGFFHWLGLHYSAAMVVVECKNYAKEIKNPEVDQLGMRFSKNRGEVGFLTCRKPDDKATLLKRCKKVADDGHGFIILLDDDDLEVLVAEIEADQAAGNLGRNKFTLLRERFGKLLGT
jgi:hypothetical protein